MAEFDKPTGRRRLLRRAGTLAAPVLVAASALVSPAPATAQAPAACGIERLAEHPAWDWSTVTGADPTGRYAVGHGTPADPGDAEGWYPVIWDRGVRRAVPVRGDMARLEDVNSRGVAVGSSRDPVSGDPVTPWMYRGGRVLPLPGVASGWAVAVNDRGDVAGNAYLGGPVWWPAGGTGARRLPLPDGVSVASAYDIDEDGTVAGSYWADDGEHAILWLPNGRTRVLAPPPGLGPMTRAVAIRKGWVAGDASTPEGGRVVVRWHLPSGETRVYPRLYYPTYVNAAGWLAGTSQDFAPLLATGTGEVELPGLVEDAPRGDAVAITDSGRAVAGGSDDAGGATHAVRWTCA